MKRLHILAIATGLVASTLVSACPTHFELSAGDVAAINANNATQLRIGADLPSASLNAIGAWKHNWTGATGHSLNPTINSFINTTLSDVQGVWFDTNYIYVKSADLPSYNVGNVGTNNTGYAQDKALTLRIPRNPTVATTPTSLGGGGVGVMVNGALTFDPGDAQTYNNGGVWRRIAQVFESSTFDSGPAHVAPGMGQLPGNSTPGTYHYHVGPTAIAAQIDAGNTGQRHSPIIGFAYDGFPIYGPYGYSDPNDLHSAIKRIASSYKIRDDLATSGAVRQSTTQGGTLLTSTSWGPNVNATVGSLTYPAGSFKEDYQYVAGLGDLNSNNVRWAVTPEYPNGTWAYYMTVDATGAPAFPYLIGPQYHGIVDTANLGPTGGKATIPAGATRLLAGDADFDGAVDYSDLLILAQNYGTQGLTLWSQGDFDSNTDIGASDLALLQQNYPASANGFAADWALAQSAVPEPSTMALALTLGASSLLRRRRSNS